MTDHPIPYRVPSMDEIFGTQKNGFKVVSTFAGTGGSSLGYRMAGFKILLANEFVPAAQESYRSNAETDTIIDTRDIRDVQAQSILDKIGMKRGELDLFDGSPPCSSFSTAGKLAKGWGEVKSYSSTSQRTDDLFIEYIRLVDGIQPKVFVAENVSGLAKGVAIGYFKRIMGWMSDVGYDVQARIVNSAWCGVPQSRHRTIFVGVRRDLGIPPAHPKPCPTVYSVLDACPWIDGSCENPFPVEDKTYLSETMLSEWHEIGGIGKSLRYFQFERPDPRRPFPTITATMKAGAGPVHPFEPRRFSVSELKRLQSFPDDFKLTGTYVQQVERIGRSVPPLMMRAIASTVAEKILSRL